MNGTNWKHAKIIYKLKKKKTIKIYKTFVISSKQSHGEIKIDLGENIQNPLFSIKFPDQSNKENLENHLKHSITNQKHEYLNTKI